MAVCFICNSKLFGERTRVCSSIAPHSNASYPDEICELVGEEFVVIVTPADHMCKRCTSLLIHMDKLENDLKLVKNAMLSYIQKKYGLLPADQPIKSIEVVNGNIRTEELEVGQRKVPSGLTVREPSTSAGASSSASSKIRQDSSKMKIYKCGFCSFQSKDLGHVRFHMRSHMKKNEKTNQTATRTVTQQQPQQQQIQNQPQQLMGIQNKQQQPQQQPYKQPQQQKKRLYRCQVCAASYDTRVDCLEHIHKDHNQQQPVAEEKETEVTLEEVAVFQPHDVQNSVENQTATVTNDDEGHLLDGKGDMNNTDTDFEMLLNDHVPNENSEVPAVQETQNISENTTDQAELLQENHEIPGTNEDIRGNETGTDHLDIESMLAAIHNDVAPPNDGECPDISIQ